MAGVDGCNAPERNMYTDAFASTRETLRSSKYTNAVTRAVMPTPTKQMIVAESVASDVPPSEKESAHTTRESRSTGARPWSENAARALASVLRAQQHGAASTSRRSLSHPSTAGGSRAADVTTVSAKSVRVPNVERRTPLQAEPTSENMDIMPHARAWRSEPWRGLLAVRSAMDASIITSGEAMLKLPSMSSTAASCGASALPRSAESSAYATEPTTDAIKTYGERWKPAIGSKSERMPYTAFICQGMCAKPSIAAKRSGGSPSPSGCSSVSRYCVAKKLRDSPNPWLRPYTKITKQT
mmetsp:Transcript_13312/g.34676  ORF Transcript_13312/g.34676 Transcript_13312/m.34676 type:complete len:298 (-) Transcript_13312:288-1181(-)